MVALFSHLVLAFTFFIQNAPLLAAPVTSSFGGLTATMHVDDVAGSVRVIDDEHAPVKQTFPTSPYQPRFKPIAEELGAVFSFLWTLIIFCGFCGAGWLVVKEWKRNPLIIEPFDVPEDLQKLGLTGSVFAQQLADEIARLQSNARPDDGPNDIAFVEFSRMQVDLQLPGMSWSVRGVIRYLKQALDKNERRLIGEIYRSGKTTYAMRIRSTRGGSEEIPKTFRSASDLQETLIAAAERAVSMTNSWESVMIMFALETPKSGYPRTLKAIQTHLATAPADQHQAAYVMWASVCKACGDQVGMASTLALARSVKLNRWTGRETGRCGPRYLNFTGSLYREQHEFDLARAMFKKALRRDRNNLGALHNLALMAADRERTAEARRWLRRLVRLRPQSSRGYRGFGLIAMREGRAYEAVHYLSRALDVAPVARWPRVNRIEAYRTIGDFDAAEADGEYLMKADPEFAPVYRVLSFIARDRFDLSLAEQRSAKAIELDSHDSWNHIEATRVALQRGDYDRAMTGVNVALSLRENLPDAFRLWAQILTYQGQVDAAILKYEEGIQRFADDRGCALDLADLLRRKGMFDRAIAIAKLALSRSRHCETLRRMAWIERDRGALATAERLLREAAALRPADPWALLDRSDILRRQRRYPEAIRAAQAAIPTKVRPAQPYRRWANALLEQNLILLAEAKLREAIEAQRCDVSPAIDLSHLLRRQERFDEAVSVIRDAASRSPHSADVLRCWARILDGLGDVEGVKAKMLSSVEWAPADVDGLIEAADFLRSNMQLSEAGAMADRAVKLRADLSACLVCKALVFQAQGNHQAAEATLLDAIAKEPELPNASVRLSRLLIDWNRNDDAIELLTEVLSKRPDNNQAIRLRANIFMASNNFDEARELYETRLNVDSLDLWIDFSQFLREHDHADDSVVAATKACEIDPFSLAAVRALAFAKFDQIGPSAAILELRKAAEMSPTEVRDLISLAEIFRGEPSVQDPEEVGRALEAALIRRPYSLEVLRISMEFDLEDAEWEAAQLKLDELCRRAPLEIRDLVRFSNGLADANMLDRALTKLEAAKQRQPHSSAVLWQLGLLLDKRNEPVLAEESFCAALAQSPWNEQYALSFSKWLVRMKQRERAISVLDIALSLRTESAPLLRALAGLLWEQGDQERTNVKLADAIKATSLEKPQDLLELAELLSRVERRADACLYAKRAAQATSPDAWFLRKIANVLRDNGGVKDAVAVFRRAVELEPDDAYLWGDFAECLFKAQMQGEAAKACEKALSLDASQWAANNVLAMIQEPPKEN